MSHFNARVRFGRILALVVAIIAISAPAAVADLGPPPPNLESASPCISVSARPHAVSVGESITGRTGPGTGGCTEKQLSWNWFAAGERVTTCATNSTVCVIKTDRPTSTWTTLCVVGTGSSGGLTACDYVAVLGAGLHDLSGTIEAGAPGSLQVSGVTVRARGPGGTHTTTTDAHGNYTFAVATGTYVVTPGRATFPAHRRVSVTRDTTGVDFALAVDHVALHFSPGSVDANGFDRYVGAATVTDTSGAPRARQPVTFTAPLNVTPRALVCGRSGLLYPTLLADGTPFGSHFLARTDSSGVIPLSVWVGTQPGSWLLQSAESDNAAVSDSLSLPFADAGAASFSPGLIAKQLGLAVGKTIGGGGINLFSNFGAVGQSQASNQAVLLAFLRTVTSAFPGADYGPVHAGGAAGIVFYRHGTADPLSSGVVMSIDEASGIVDAVGSGHPIPSGEEALTPLATWAAQHGVSSPSGALGSLAPPPQERLLYFGFPYPPPATDAGAQVSFYGPCLAPDPALQIVQTHSPVRLSFAGAGGYEFGLGAGGQRIDHGTGLIERTGDVTSYVIPTGNYTMSVTATGAGPATIVTLSPGRNAQRVQSLTLTVHKGQSGRLSLARQGATGALVIAGRRVRPSAGLPLTLSGLPQHLRVGRRTTATVRITSLGAPVPGAVVTVGGRVHTVAVTDQHGVVRLSLHPAARGRVMVTVTSPGSHALTRTVTVTGR